MLKRLEEIRITKQFNCEVGYTRELPKIKRHFFRQRRSDRAQILHVRADRDEIGSQLKKN